MEQNYEILIIILPLIFLAGFVDSIAGGGGIISMSALLMTGIPVHYALGTNKLQAFSGTVVSTMNYIKHDHYKKEFIFFSVFGAIIGAFIGTNIALAINAEILKLIILIILPIIAIIMLSKKRPSIVIENYSKSKISIIIFLIGFTTGVYDGMIGPGTGTFLIILFSICGLSLLDANGNAKIVNTITNVVSTIIFFVAGKAILWIAIPSIFVNILANYLGSKMAISNGDKIIKPVIVLVLIMLFIKIGFDLYSAT